MMVAKKPETVLLYGHLVNFQSRFSISVVWYHFYSTSHWCSSGNIMQSQLAVVANSGCEDGLLPALPKQIPGHLPVRHDQLW